MPNDSFFKNIKNIEKFLEEKDSILKGTQDEEKTSEWVEKHHKYIKEQSINPFRYYAAVFHRDPRVIKMLLLAEKLNKRMRYFIENYETKKVDDLIDQCNTFLYEFGNACGYFNIDISEKYNQINFYKDNLTNVAKHSERYKLFKEFEKNLNVLKQKAKPDNLKSEIQPKKVNINSKNNITNDQIILDKFKEDILPKIESTALTIYKYPISETFKPRNFKVSHNQTSNLSFVKKIAENNDKNSTALTIWKPPLSQQFENANQLKQYVVKNLPEIKKAILKNNINSNNNEPIKQFIVKNFSEIKKAFLGENNPQTIKRSNTFTGESTFRVDNNKPSKKEEKNDYNQTANQDMKSNDNNISQNDSNNQICNEDKIAVKNMDLNSVQITYYRTLVSLFKNAKNGLRNNFSDLSQKIKRSILIEQFENLGKFNNSIERLCVTNADGKQKIKISIMQAIRQTKIKKDELQKWKSYFDQVKKEFYSIASYIFEQTKKDDKNKIYDELWEKTTTLINFKSKWKNKSTKELFEYNKKLQNSDNIKCLKLLYYLRRIFEILNKSAIEHKNK